MNLKSYLRGIGAGLIIAALIMGVAVKKPVISDTTEIKQTLLESVSTTTSSEPENESGVSVSVREEEDITSNTSASATDKETEKTDIPEETITTETSVDTSTPAETPGTADGDDNSATAQDTQTADTDNSQTVSEDSSSDTAAIQAGNGSQTDNDQSETSVSDTGNGDETENGDEYVTIVIEKGDSSKNVARKVYTAGLVESAPAFDKFLCSNGYDKSIKVGTFKIPVGSDRETIAKIISKKK